MIYLDNNATTKVDKKVVDEMMPYFEEEYANPSSMYDFSKKASKAIKESREMMKEFFNAKTSNEIIFTSCGSESANTAIRGLLETEKNKKHIITTKVEHPCVLNVFKYYEKQGYKVDYIGVNSNGELDLAELQEKVDKDTALVATMWANNETGVIFPVQKISEIVKSKNPETKLFVDAVQVAGKIDIDVQTANIDMLGVSGHKFHAPKGVGALYVKSGTLLNPLIIGGHQERGKRAGTENVPYIVGIAKAAELAKESLKYEATEIKRLRDKLETNIVKNICNAKLNTSISNRVPNTTNIGFEYIEGELILLHLSDIGICASSGSACTSGSLDPSHVLLAIGRVHDVAHGSLRLSLGEDITDEDADYIIKSVKEVVEYLRGFSPVWRDLVAGKGTFIL